MRCIWSIQISTYSKTIEAPTHTHPNPLIQQKTPTQPSTPPPAPLLPPITLPASAETVAEEVAAAVAPVVEPVVEVVEEVEVRFSLSRCVCARGGGIYR